MILTQCHNICSQEEKAVPYLKDKGRVQAQIWEGEAEKLNIRHTTSRKKKKDHLDHFIFQWAKELSRAFTCVDNWVCVCAWKRRFLEGNCVSMQTSAHCLSIVVCLTPYWPWEQGTCLEQHFHSNMYKSVVSVSRLHRSNLSFVIRCLCGLGKCT